MSGSERKLRFPEVIPFAAPHPPVPTLNWIGKDAVSGHHQQVPFRLLENDDAHAVNADGGDSDAHDNLLVEGDNLEALKSLLPHYAGAVKCVYIDPPYNTGNEGWSYNDKVDSPQIRRWLHETVGSEAEDLSCHDKWLSMMHPRLMLLHELLAEDGSFWMSIDETRSTTPARSLIASSGGRTSSPASSGRSAPRQMRAWTWALPMTTSLCMPVMQTR